MELINLDNKHNLIYSDVQKLYKVIKDANESLERLRSCCIHPQTYIGNYMWGPGHISECEICNVCGEVVPLKIHNELS